MSEDVIKALSESEREKGFESIKENWGMWSYRNDLFDHAITKGVGFLLEFINQVEDAKRHILATLFLKRPDVVDNVLTNIGCDHDDLIHLTSYQPELAELHDKFFKVIDKLKDPEHQVLAVYWGVLNLFEAGKHNSVFPLINALEKRPFNGIRLKNTAIQMAFQEGAIKGIKDIVEDFLEHPAITHERYAIGLVYSWDKYKSKKTVFPSLLAQADKGDLGRVKEMEKYGEDPDFRNAIDNAREIAPSAGTRHLRFLNRIESAKLAIKTLTEHVRDGGQAWKQEPGSIVLSYLLGEEEGTKVMGKMQMRKEKGTCIIM